MFQKIGWWSTLLWSGRWNTPQWVVQTYHSQDGFVEIQPVCREVWTMDNVMDHPCHFLTYKFIWISFVQINSFTKNHLNSEFSYEPKVNFHSVCVLCTCAATHLFMVKRCYVYENVTYGPSQFDLFTLSNKNRYVLKGMGFISLHCYWMYTGKQGLIWPIYIFKSYLSI